MKSDRCYPIVVPSNARTPEYAAELNSILESGICPFCPDGYTFQNQPVVEENRSWVTIGNKVPHPDADCHLVLIPRRHVNAFHLLTLEELGDMQAMISQLAEKHAAEGYVIYGRSGDPELTGATVGDHCHLQFTIPKRDHTITVLFGPPPQKK